MYSFGNGNFNFDGIFRAPNKISKICVYVPYISLHTLIFNRKTKKAIRVCKIHDSPE